MLHSRIWVQEASKWSYLWNNGNDEVAENFCLFFFLSIYFSSLTCELVFFFFFTSKALLSFSPKLGNHYPVNFSLLWIYWGIIKSKNHFKYSGFCLKFRKNLKEALFEIYWHKSYAVFKHIFNDFGERKEEDRERKTTMRKKCPSAASCTHLNPLLRNLGMCSDWESNHDLLIHG